jgi:hypothetical protein
MESIVSGLFVFSLLFGSLDAALDLELDPIRNGDSHEMHGGVHDNSAPRPEDPDGEPAKHFCHCAAHAPAVASTNATVLLSGDDSVPDSVSHFYRDSRAPPLLPPPIV